MDKPPRHTRSARRLGIAIVLGAAVLWTADRTIARAAAKVECPKAPKTLIFVDTTEHALATCEDGRAIETFTVRLGRKGTGKTREGDGKTPLGSYPISEPRPSASYGMFVPVDYPTLEQRRSGFTGGAIGVHGPDRRVRWAGALVNILDTTDGCIGIATDEEMSRIVDWIRMRKVKAIVLK